MSIFKELAQLENTPCRYALCTIVGSSGSTPRKVSAKMIVIDNNEPAGTIVGTIGGGAIEHLCRINAVKLIRSGTPQLFTVNLRNDLGMCCGGEMSIFIEPILKKPQLICFGAGHIAQVVCPLSVSLGYRVTVADERKNLLMLDAFSSCSHQVDTSLFALKDLSYEGAFVLVATHDHALDQNIVESILAQPYSYLALVGSKRKALMTKKRLLAKGFLKDYVARLRCPAGLAINASTPQEIALSILAEMTLVKNGREHK